MGVPSYKYTCNHVPPICGISVSSLLESIKEQTCTDCECKGPNLWICLYQNCFKIGCSEDYNDHSTLHNSTNPSHCIHMNLSTKRIWCYECKSEVFMEPPHNAKENSQTQLSSNKTQDSGHGSYSTLQSSPERAANVYAFERNVGLNVGMNWDSSDSSESEDGAIYNLEKPAGLVGLQNIGNTCYMNAALQALSNATPLTKFFLDCGATVQVLSDGKKPGLSRTYQALMRDIWVKKNGGYVTPSGILYGIRSVHPMFRGYHQHDTQEFLRNFMDQLHEELKQPSVLEVADSDTFAMAMDESTFSSSYDSSEGEYETCDSGVSERSSLSDETERTTSNAKRRLSRSTSPGRRLKARMHNSGGFDTQPTLNSNMPPIYPSKKQLKYRSVISDIFDGKLLSSVQCLTCNRISSRVETFQDLSLPIPSRDHLMLLHGRIPGSTTMCTEAVIPVQDGWISWIISWFKSWFYGPTVTLHDCLAAFFSTDELKGDNMYSCEKCNKLRNGIKFSKVLQLPEILCIHLKRFRHELMFSSKISSAVSFPSKGLDMKPYLHTDCVSKVTSYELFSVICHHGTAGGGHYISYALNDGQWYEFDDQYVTRVSPEKIEMCEAYVLFYRKVSNHIEQIRTKANKMSETQDEVKDVAYISKQWLSRFNNCAEPGPIDNSDFLCQHGYINPDREMFLEQLTVALPLTVYNYLYKIFGGCAPMTNAHLCPVCQAFQKRLLLEMETFAQLSIQAQNQDIQPTHLISTSWYKLWHGFVQRRSQEPPGPIDNSKINVNRLDNDCAEVTEDIWNFFHSIYGGGPEIRLRSKDGLMPNEDIWSRFYNSNGEQEVCNQDVDMIEDNTIVNDRLVNDDNEVIEEEIDGECGSPLQVEEAANSFCHGEPMEVYENAETVECEKPHLKPQSCRSSTEVGNVNCTYVNVNTSRSLTNDSIKVDTGRRRRKLLDSKV